jgi:hypothetical protein
VELESLLGMIAPDVRIVTGCLGDYSRLSSYAVLPTFQSPRVLVPTATREAAAGLVRLRKGSWQRSLRGKLVRAVVCRALAAGVLQRFALDTVHLLEGLSTAVDVRATSHLGDHLSALLGKPVVLGAGVGRRDPHQSQVIYAMSLAGEPVAFVKIAWNELTRRLLRREAKALKRWSEAGVRDVTVPSLLHHGPWGEYEILVTAPLDVPQHVIASRSNPPGPTITLDVASVGDRGRRPLGESAYWADVGQRVDEFAPYDHPLHALLVSTIATLRANAADTVLEFGGWHGDWLPWNFCPGRDGLLVWDWEYWSDCAPLGFDVLHFYYGTAFYADGLDALAALRRSERAAVSALGALGVEPAVVPLVFTLYVVEMLLRRLEISSSGGGADDESIFPAIRSVLQSRGKGLQPGPPQARLPTRQQDGARTTPLDWTPYPKGASSAGRPQS